MARQNVKNIEVLATELKNKVARTNTNCDYKIGIIVACDNSYSRSNYPFSLANLISQKILSMGYESEIISLPSINERLREYCVDNYVVSAYKKQIANYLEMLNYEKNFDSVIFIPSGFNCTVGCLLSSIRLNLPTIIFPQGLSNKVENRNLNDVLTMPGQIATNKKSVFDLENCKKEFCETIGTGVTFNTENIFNNILEIMELTLAGSALTLANSFEKEDETIEVANKIVELTKSRLPLKKMINKKSITNALLLNFCMGGSPKIISALSELAKEAEIDLDVEKMLSYVSKAPVLYNTLDNIESFKQKGGIKGIVKAMIKNKIIDGNYSTFSGKTLSEYVKDASEYENFLTPIKKESLVVFHGNIADKFALTKNITLREDKTKIISTAVVFNSDEEASNAVLNNIINKGETIVIKANYTGNFNCPCTVCKTPLALKSVNKASEHIIITDGYVSDDSDCICICCVSSNDSDIKYLQNGDELEIDFIKGKLNVELGSREFNLRQKKYISERRAFPKYFKTLK